MTDRQTQTTDDREYTREEMREACQNNYNAGFLKGKESQTTEQVPHILTGHTLCSRCPKPASIWVRADPFGKTECYIPICTDCFDVRSTP